MRWETLLERCLKCPSCGAPSINLDADPTCKKCGWVGALTADGIPDFVGNNAHQYQDELQAQNTAVDEYYENDLRLTCHWDRISADEIPELLGWPTGVALDLGCGTGTAGNGLRRTGTKVIGADLVPACLVAAQRRLDAVVRVDASELPFADESFDALIMRGALHHLADPRAALQEAARVLKPAAPAVFADPRHFNWLEPIKQVLRRGEDSFTDDHHAYGVGEYRSLIEQHFALEEVHTDHPFGILIAHGLDLFPLPRHLPRRLLAEGLYRLDTALNQTPFRHGGHLIVATGHRRP